MKKYLNAMLLSIKDESLFKVNYYLGLFSIPIQVFIAYLFWKNTININEIEGFTLNSLVLYFLFLQTLQVCFQSAMYTTYELWNSINSGTIIVWLVRPIYYPLYIFYKKIATFIPRLLISIVIITVGLSFFNYKFDFRVLTLGYFSSFIGFIILFQIQFIIGCLTFWIDKVIALRDTIISFLFLLGGFIIPIDFMPNVLKEFSFLTPMPYIYYLPAKILSKKILLVDIFLNMKIQLIWFVILWVIIIVVWKAGSYNIEQGS